MIGLVAALRSRVVRRRGREQRGARSRRFNGPASLADGLNVDVRATERGRLVVVDGDCHLGVAGAKEAQLRRVDSQNLGDFATSRNGERVHHRGVTRARQLADRDGRRVAEAGTVRGDIRA